MKRTLEALNGVVLFFMFSITMLSVICRVVLEVPASWTEELAQYTLIFLAFIGAAALMKDEGHIAISVVTDRMGPGARRAVRIVNRLLMLPFLIVLTLGALDNAKMNWMVGLSTAEWMKMGYMYLVVFLSGLIMTFYVLMNLYKDIVCRKSTASEPGGAG